MMRILNSVAMVLTIALVVVLYHIKYDAQESIRHIDKLKAELRHERDTINILRAEWSHLNQPQRLQKLARRYTKLQPLTSKQIVTFNDLPLRRRETGPYGDGKTLGGFAGGGASGSSIQ